MADLERVNPQLLIRDYIIKERIGAGSFGLVYKVVKKKQNKFLVLKQIPFTTNTDANIIEEARNEAKLLSLLNNPYVVKYYESFEENDNLNIVMEYCDGGDLSSFISKVKKQRLIIQETQIWKFFIQMSIGLHYIHSKKILHRDLKSMNIFLTKNLDVKIGDLGVAKNLKNTSHAYTFIGTPYYLSPEILEEKPYNEKSDVWALGCILYELCTFNHPYNASNQAALFIKIKNSKFEPISPVFSNELKLMIDILLNKDCDNRPSMNEVIKMNVFIEKSKTCGLFEELLKYIQSIEESRLCPLDGKRPPKSKQIKLIKVEPIKKKKSKTNLQAPGLVSSSEKKKKFNKIMSGRKHPCSIDVSSYNKKNDKPLLDKKALLKSANNKASNKQVNLNISTENGNQKKHSNNIGQINRNNIRYDFKQNSFQKDNQGYQVQSSILSQNNKEIKKPNLINPKRILNGKKSLRSVRSKSGAIATKRKIDNLNTGYNNDWNVNFQMNKNINSKRSEENCKQPNYHKNNTRDKIIKRQRKLSFGNISKRSAGLHYRDSSNDGNPKGLNKNKVNKNKEISIPVIKPNKLEKKKSLNYPSSNYYSNNSNAMFEYVPQFNEEPLFSKINNFQIKGRNKFNVQISHPNANIAKRLEPEEKTEDNFDFQIEERKNLVAHRSNCNNRKKNLTDADNSCDITDMNYNKSDLSNEYSQQSDSDNSLSNDEEEKVSIIKGGVATDIIEKSKNDIQKDLDKLINEEKAYTQKYNQLKNKIYEYSDEINVDELFEKYQQIFSDQNSEKIDDITKEINIYIKKNAPKNHEEISKVFYWIIIYEIEKKTISKEIEAKRKNLRKKN